MKSYTLEELEKLRKEFCNGGPYIVDANCNCDDDYYCCPITTFFEWMKENKK